MIQCFVPHSEATPVLPVHVDWYADIVHDLARVALVGLQQHFLGIAVPHRLPVRSSSATFANAKTIEHTAHAAFHLPAEA
jgi:hypothetical protein